MNDKYIESTSQLIFLVIVLKLTIDKYFDPNKPSTYHSVVVISKDIAKLQQSKKISFPSSLSMCTNFAGYVDFFGVIDTHIRKSAALFSGIRASRSLQFTIGHDLEDVESERVLVDVIEFNTFETN